MDSLRYYLPGILVWAIGVSIVLAIFMEYFGAAWGPPFYMAYYGFLALFVLSIYVPVPKAFRKHGGGNAPPEGSGSKPDRT